jgi:hypothetical protein
MKAFDDIYTDLKVLDLLGEVEPLLSRLLQAEEETATNREYLQRLDITIKLAAHRYEATDRFFIPHQTATHLAKQFTQLKSHLEQYEADKEESLLQKSNGNADNILIYLSRIPYVGSEGDADALQESISSLRRSTSQHIRYAQDEVQGFKKSAGELSKNLEGLKSEISTQKQRLDTAISNFQSQFSESQEKRLKQFENSQNKHDEDVKNLIAKVGEKSDAIAKANEEALSEFQENTAKTLDEAQTQLTEFGEKADAKLEELLTKAKSDLEEVIQAAEGQANEALQELESQKVKAKELVGLIANTGMSGGYQKVLAILKKRVNMDRSSGQLDHRDQRLLASAA